MTAKEYLNQIKEARMSIKAEKERLANMKTMAMSIGTKELKADRVQTSVKNEGLEGTVGNYVDYESKIIDRIEEYKELEEQIVDEIYGMNCDYKLKNVIYFRYVHLKSYKEVANMMGYTEQHVKRLHGQALKLFGQQYREKLNGSDNSI
jgi:DNA-directed RNA polymerase specialized sigma subunit